MVVALRVVQRRRGGASFPSCGPGRGPAESSVSVFGHDEGGRSGDRMRPPAWVVPAQALGFLPWLADLPLRERRLRARLLMVTPCVRALPPCAGDVTTRHSVTSPRIAHAPGVGPGSDQWHHRNVKKIMALVGATTLALTLSGPLTPQGGADWAAQQRSGADWALPFGLSLDLGTMHPAGADWAALQDDGADWALPFGLSFDWRTMRPAGADWATSTDDGADWAASQDDGADWAAPVATGSSALGNA